MGFETVSVVGIVLCLQLQESQRAGNVGVEDRHIHVELQFPLVGNVQVEPVGLVDAEAEVEFPTDRQIHVTLGFQAQARDADVEADAGAVLNSPPSLKSQSRKISFGFTLG